MPIAAWDDDEAGGSIPPPVYTPFPRIEFIVSHPHRTYLRQPTADTKDEIVFIVPSKRRS